MATLGEVASPSRPSSPILALPLVLGMCVSLGATAFHAGGGQTALQPIERELPTKFSLRESGNISAHLRPVAVAVEDFNEDGNPDLAVANFISNDVSILLGDGRGNFAPPMNLAVGRGPTALASADFDRDGHKDVVVANHLDGSVTNLVGKGNGGFSRAETLRVGIRPVDLVVSDFDSDGKADIAVANSGSSDISILYGRGDGGFLHGQTIALGGEPVALRVARLGPHGSLTLVVSTRNENSIALFQVREGGVLAEWPGLDLENSPMALEVADVNRDGFQDLVIGHESTILLLVASWDSSGPSFLRQIAVPVNGNPTSLAVEDFNGDDYPDLVAAVGQAERGLPSFTQNPDGSFLRTASVGDSLGLRRIYPWDLNHDGAMDLLTLDFEMDRGTVFLNSKSEATKSLNGPSPGPASDVVPIGLGQSVNGNLSSSAPAANCNFGTPADRYSLSLSGTTTVTISLSSSAFDAVACLLNSTNTLIQQDDDSGGGLNSRITLSLAAGDYFIEVTSFSGSGVGVYTLSVQQTAPSGATTIGLGQTLVGQLSSSAPAANCSGSAPADRYEFTLSTSTTVTIDLTSTAFDTVVCLFNSSNQFLDSDTNFGSGTNSRLTRSLSAGSYFLEVTTDSPGGAGGIYTLALQQGFPPGKPIALGQTVTGNLSSTAPNANCSGGAPAVRYLFDLPASSTVTIDLTSTAFDTVVCLFNSSNQFLDSDTNFGSGTNSRLTRSLSAGSYFLEVTTDSPGGAGGTYSLSLQEGFPPGQPISLGQTVTGNLSSTAPNANCSGGAPADRYEFTLSTSTTVTIDLTSTAFDTVVCLFNSSNQFLDSDTNFGSGTNSRLTRSLSAGSYFLEVTTDSPGGAGGTYSLSLQEGFPPGQPITLGQTVTGNLSSIAPNANCSGGAPADRYEFTLSTSTTVTIDLTSTAFDTVVCLLNSSNQFLDSDTNSGSGTNSRLTRSLSAGSYFLEVTTDSPGGAGGTYTLSLQEGFSSSPEISLGQVVTGNLSSTAPNANCSGGAPADRYSFSLSAPTTVTIDLTSTAFDTVVCVFNSSNQFLASDDNSGSGTNSRLTSTLSTGSYFLEVTTDSPGGAGGTYSLSLREGFPPGQLVGLGQAVTGNLSSTAPNANCSGGAPADRYEFALSRSTAVTIDVSSTAFDTVVCLYDSTNRFIDSDDNSGGGTNSQLMRTLSVGGYFLEVTTDSPGGAGGTYTLALGGGTAPDNVGDSAVVPTSGFSESVDTTSATTEVADPTPSCGGGSRANSVWYQFTPDADGELHIDTLESDYDTILSLWTGGPGNFTEAACNDDTSGSDSGQTLILSQTVPTGQSSVSLSAGAGTTYFIMVSGKTGGGSLTITLSFQSQTQPTPPTVSQTVMPHSALGGGFLSRLFITNLTSDLNRLVINRVNQSGAVVDSASTFLTPAATAQVTASEEARTGALRVEWFTVGSDGPVAASLLFEFDSASLNLGEDFRTAVGTLAAPPLTAFTVPVRVATVEVTLGLALAELSGRSNTLSMTLIDENGTTVAQDAITLGAFQQTAFSLQDRAAFRDVILGVPEFIGSLAVTTAFSDQPVAAIVVGNNRRQLFTLPVTPGVALTSRGSGTLSFALPQEAIRVSFPGLAQAVPAGNFITIIPHSASGGGFLSRLFITNLSANSNSVSVNRIAQNATVLETRNLTLQSAATVMIADSEDVRTQGLTIQWFAIASERPIASSLLFEFDSASLGLEENFRTAVGTLAAAPLSEFTVPVRVATAEITAGMALANVNGGSTTVNLALINQGGTVVAQDFITLGAFEQTAFSLQDRAAFRDLILGVPEFIGSLAVTTTDANRPVAALVIGNNLRQLFSLPVTPGVAQ